MRWRRCEDCYTDSADHFLANFTNMNTIGIGQLLGIGQIHRFDNVVIAIGHAMM